MKRKSLFIVTLMGTLILGVAVYRQADLNYSPAEKELPADFATFYAEKLALSRAAGVRPGNEERLVQNRPVAKIAFLYIHGFGASRAEGEAVIDPLARVYAANVYYLRLPGHGANMEDHASRTYQEYLDLVTESFQMTRKLGEKVVVVGSSTGGLLATYLAARFPDQVAGLVVTSPLYGFADPSSFVLSLPGGIQLIEAIYGKERNAGWTTDPEKRKQNGYEDYWLVRQKYRALLILDRLLRTIVDADLLGGIRAPLLMLYYYKDEENRDTIIDLEQMHRVFEQIGTPPEKKRKVAIADGNHILTSAYVRTDKEQILAEMKAFLDSLSR
ncbi:MAG: alpha/beta hydrolase [Spirochaetales bacterium]|nr:alpha/beta hydrolase [Spirochaetales bacterium]